jgi:hypothetical protein
VLEQRDHRNDFVCLCRASLSFVQDDGSDSLLPFGLTMRAFCHTAIYADLLAAQKVLPPVSGAQVRYDSASTVIYLRPILSSLILILTVV